MFKPLLTILAGSLLTSSVFAQVELAADHPDTYVVQEGDTLWDIATRFLADPWLWPEIWQVNPQVDDPHLIYPGDVLSLSIVGGQPRLSLQRADDSGIKKLSPQIRRRSLEDAIKPIQLDSIRPFLDKRTVLSPEEIEGLPYVVAIQEDHLGATTGLRVYVRDLDAQPGETYAIVKPTVRFLDVPAQFPWSRGTKSISEPWAYPAERSITDYVDDFWNETVLAARQKHITVLGYEVREAAVGEVISSGDPSVLELVSTGIEVRPGDMVIPIFSANFDYEYYPHAVVDVPENTRVISLSRALFGAGRNQVVALNRGGADGLENGHVLRLNRPSREVRDEVRYPRDDVKTYFSRERRRDATVELPEEYSAHVLIFKTYDDISYGLIVRSAQAVKVGDIARQP